MLFALPLMPTTMAGLYIHIPFCKQACHYCDFHFSTQPGSRLELIQAIARELRLQKNYLNNLPLSTIYFGGGTPSLLTRDEIQIIFEAIHENYTVDVNPEITLEANPDDLTHEKLTNLQQAGINRLSIGIQSFDDKILKFLNRAHASADAIQCVQNARAVGFSNISLDLMYSIPGQTREVWQKNIAQAISFEPEHLSAYSLTLEEKTAFGKWHRSGKLMAVDEEAAAEQFEWLMDMLGEAGYDHYEISNFCKPGCYARHNSGYWKQELYMGVGPSGHSYNGVTRQFNISNNTQYIKSIRDQKVPFEIEVLSLENKINEYIFTTLRTSWGCDLNKLKYDFQFDLRTLNKDYLLTLQKEKLATLENETLKLTRAGKLLADRIASDLFVDFSSNS